MTFNALNPDTFGFTCKPYGHLNLPTRLQFYSEESGVPTVYFVILPTLAGGNAVLAVRSELNSPDENNALNSETVTEIRLAFASQDTLLMACANPTFIAAAMWNLIGELPANAAEALLCTPCGDLPRAISNVATDDNNDPDLNLDLTRYQISELTFAMFGATEL